MLSIIITTLIIVISQMTHASTYYLIENGKQVEVTKGQAIAALYRSKQAKVIKVDEVELNYDKATLRNKKAR